MSLSRAFPFCFHAAAILLYTAITHLFFNNSILLSQEGVQQGDPLGPLLFCLVIHPLVKKLKSELRIFYLDDGLIGGTALDVPDDIRMIRRGGRPFWSPVQLAQSELTCEHNHRGSGCLQSTELIHIHPEDATFLRAPIGPLASVDSVLSEKIGALRIMGERLIHFQRHDALLLLCHSFAIPRVLYLLRTSLRFLSSKLNDFDCLLRSTLMVVLNISLSDDCVWHQTTLPRAPLEVFALGVESSLLPLLLWPQLLAVLLSPSRFYHHA